MGTSTVNGEPVDPGADTTDIGETGDLATGDGDAVASVSRPLRRLQSRGAVMIATLLSGSLAVTLAAGYFLSYFGGPVSPLLRYVPEDSNVVALWRMPELLSSADALDDFGGFEVRAWGLPYGLNGYELRVGSLVLDTWHVSEYLMAADLQSDSGVSLLRGDFVFDYVREDLASLGFQEESYRGYEVWAGREHYALFPDDGVIMVAAQESWLREVINLRHRGAGMLPDALGHGINHILERLGSAGFVFASVDRDTEWGCPLKRCRGYGVALTGYDIDELEAKAEFAVLFSSDRAAQVAADEYDEVLRFAESVPTNGFFSYRGPVIVVDAVADCKLVVGDAVVSP